MISSACGDTATLIVGISPMELAEIDNLSAGPFCAADGPSQLNITSLSTPGGTWSGGVWVNSTGTFDPSSATVSSNNKVIYTTPGVCSTTTEVDITVVGQIKVDVVNTPLERCNDKDNIDLVTLLNPITSSINGSWTVSPATSGVISGSEFVVTAAIPGDYTVKYSLYGGTATCADSDSVVIRVLPVLDPSVKSGPISDICISTSTYQFINTGDNGGTWSIDGIGVIDAISGVMDLKTSGTGPFTITYGFTGSGICPIDSSTTITVVGPGDPTIQEVQPICEDFDPVIVKATGTQGGVWSSSATGIDPVTGVFNPTVSGSGDHEITYSLTGVCPIDSSITITVLPVMDPTIGNIPAGDVCISDKSYKFTNTGDPSGTWTITGSGVIDPVTGEVDLVNSDIGTFTVSYSFGGVCERDSSTVIKIVGPGDPTIVASGPFCENLGTQQIVASGTQGGTWSGTGVDPITGVFSPSISGSGTHLINYSLIGTCPIDSTINIIVEEVPVMDIQVDKSTGCEPLTVKFSDASTSKALTSSWTFSDGSQSALTDSVTMTFSNPGCYNVILVSEFVNGCKDSIPRSNIVCVNPVPKADFDWGPKNATVIEPFIEFDDKSINATSLVWNFDRGAVPITSSDENPFVTFTSSEKGVYNVCLMATNGACFNEICKDVTILDNFSVFVPNAFTPDGDGLNDVFFPNGKSHDNLEGLDQYGFMIFNRWGELIWETTTPYQPWDATDQKTGNVVMQDVYVWKVNAWDHVEGTLKTYYGHISVLR